MQNKVALLDKPLGRKQSASVYKALTNNTSAIRHKRGRVYTATPPLHQHKVFVFCCRGVEEMQVKESKAEGKAEASQRSFQTFIF